MRDIHSLRKSVTGNGNEKRWGHVLWIFFFFQWSIALHSRLYLFLTTLPSPKFSPSHHTPHIPRLEWCICMEITVRITSSSFQGVFPSPLFLGRMGGGVIFIYLSRTHAPFCWVLKCKIEREREKRALLSKRDCY